MHEIYIVKNYHSSHNIHHLLHTYYASITLLSAYINSLLFSTTVSYYEAHFSDKKAEAQRSHINLNPGLSESKQLKQENKTAHG